MYKTYIKLRLTYAAATWHHLAAPSRQYNIQQKHNVTLRRILDAPRYVTNNVIQRDLKIESIE